MQSFYREFENRNVGLAAISTDLLVDVERMEELAGAEFPILADTNEEVSKDFGVFNLLGDGVAVPATFVIRPDGGVVWGYVGVGHQGPRANTGHSRGAGCGAGGGGGAGECEECKQLLYQNSLNALRSFIVASTLSSLPS